MDGTANLLVQCTSFTTEAIVTIVPKPFSELLSGTTNHRHIMPEIEKAFWNFEILANQILEKDLINRDRWNRCFSANPPWIIESGHLLSIPRIYGEIERDTVRQLNTAALESHLSSLPGCKLLCINDGWSNPEKGWLLNFTLLWTTSLSWGDHFRCAFKPLLWLHIYISVSLLLLPKWALCELIVSCIYDIYMIDNYLFTLRAIHMGKCEF